MVELPELRTAFSKTYDVGNGQRRIRCRTAPIHYRDAQNVWRDINTDNLDITLTMTDAPYILEGRANVIGMKYTSRASGEVLTCRLVEIGGTPVASLPLVVNPTRSGRAIVWDSCLPGLTIGLRLLPGGISWVKRLADATVPRSFTWRIEYPSNIAGIILPTTVVGSDNITRDAVEGRTVRSFPLECTINYTVVSDNGTTKVVRLTETWTGRIVKRGIPATDVVYPVEFDPSFQETITANADDGEEYSDSTWSSTATAARTGSYYGTNSNCGLRFTVGDGSGPASGATINSATLTVDVLAKAGSPNITVRGDNVDNAAAWGSSSRPSQISSTTATVSWTPTVTGSQSITVTSIVQEIVNRAGWAQGNAMRFALMDNATGNNYARIIQLENGTSGEADLDITYTAGGSKSLLVGSRSMAHLLVR